MRFWGPWPNIVPALWRALPSGRVYVPDASQCSIHVYDDIMVEDPGKIRRFEFGFAPEGIWGLDEQNIYAWGIRQQGPGNQVPHLAHFDGTQWVDLEPPSFFITKIHGLAPDLLFAAGRGGVARWDGRVWTELPTPTDDVLSDVFVSSPEEVYATSYAGTLLQSAGDAWRIVARTPDPRLPFCCVAKFADELFVGGGSLGLFRRTPNTDDLELIKPNIHATHFEARETLIITAPTKIIGTSDGQRFRSTAADAVLNGTRHIDIEQL
jgi:hypothetical protein